MWSLGYVRLPKTTQNCSDLNYRVLCLLCFHHYRHQKGWQVPLILESKTILLSTKGASKIVNYGFQDQFTSILCMFLVINGWGLTLIYDWQLVPHGKSSQMVGEFVDQKRGWPAKPFSRCHQLNISYVMPCIMLMSFNVVNPMPWNLSFHHLGGSINCDTPKSWLVCNGKSHSIIQSCMTWGYPCFRKLMLELLELAFQVQRGRCVTNYDAAALQCILPTGVASGKHTKSD